MNILINKYKYKLFKFINIFIERNDWLEESFDG